MSGPRCSVAGRAVAAVLQGRLGAVSEAVHEQPARDRPATAAAFTYLGLCQQGLASTFRRRLAQQPDGVAERCRW